MRYEYAKNFLGTIKKKPRDLYSYEIEIYAGTGDSIIIEGFIKGCQTAIKVKQDMNLDGSWKLPVISTTGVLTEFHTDRVVDVMTYSHMMAEVMKLMKIHCHFEKGRKR